jgi:hypothetical protein
MPAARHLPDVRAARGHDVSLRLRTTLPLPARAHLRPSGGGHLEPGGGAGGAVRDGARRQRHRRCGRRGSGPERGRADHERRGRRSVRAGVGRRRAACAERLGALTGGVDARALRRPQLHARARLGRGDGARRRQRLGRPLGALWQPALRNAARARHRLCAERLPGAAKDGGAVGPGRVPLRRVPRVPARVLARRPRAGRWRMVRAARSRAFARSDRREPRRCAVYRRARRAHRTGRTG